MAAAYAHSAEPREFNLNASKGELGLGGIKPFDFSLNVDAMLDSTQSRDIGYSPHAQTRTELNVDRFLFSGQTEHVSVKIGHHKAARQGLLFDNNTDWGLSATGDLDALDSNLSVFAVSAGAVPETPGDMRQSREMPWYTGGIWQSALPLPGSDTTVWAGYVNGSNAGPGPGLLSGVQASLQYRLGYSVGLQSSWQDDRLSLELEQATSRFSGEGRNSREDLSDNAYLASMVYQPELGLPYLNSTVGAEARDIGSAFYSPGNRSISGARSYERIYLNLEPFSVGSLGYSYQEKDFGQEPYQLSSYGNEVFADLSFSPLDWLSLQPYGEFERLRFDAFDTTRHRSLFSLTADAWLIPKLLRYRNTIKLTRTHGPENAFISRDRRHQHIAGELQWQALSPTPNRSGLDLNLSFSADRHETRLNPGGGLDDYQVLLSISSSGGGLSRIW